jgi:hypothetical protein
MGLTRGQLNSVKRSCDTVIGLAKEGEIQLTAGAQQELEDLRTGAMAELEHDLHPPRQVQPLGGNMVKGVQNAQLQGPQGGNAGTEFPWIAMNEGWHLSGMTVA